MTGSHFLGIRDQQPENSITGEKREKIGRTIVLALPQMF